jgi:hypothetical protein
MPKLLPGISLRSGRTDSAGTSIESTVASVNAEINQAFADAA